MKEKVDRIEKEKQRVGKGSFWKSDQSGLTHRYDCFFCATIIFNSK